MRCESVSPDTSNKSEVHARADAVQSRQAERSLLEVTLSLADHPAVWVEHIHDYVPRALL